MACHPRWSPARDTQLTSMGKLLYLVGRFLQLMAMSLLLMATVTAGPLGPSPRIFGAGVAVFVVGWLIVRQRVGPS